MKVPHPTPEASDETGASRLSVRQVIDMAHLARQTMDDELVQREVLVLFAGQARRCTAEIAEADEVARKTIAHRLLGAARGVGAFAVADAAQALEDNPSNEMYVAAVCAAVERAETEIRVLCA